LRVDSVSPGYDEILADPAVKEVREAWRAATPAGRHRSEAQQHQRLPADVRTAAPHARHPPDLARHPAARSKRHMNDMWPNRIRNDEAPAGGF
jgi:hypothetical protein